MSEEEIVMAEAVESRTPESEPTAPARRHVVVPHEPGNRQRAGALLLVLFIKAVVGTVRMRVRDESGFFDSPPAGQAIYACWHNRLAVCMDAYFGYARSRINTRGMAAMVSASRDGAFLSAVLEAFKVQPVRGSTSRRGRQALLEMTRWAERGYDLAITPDGPRGPRYKVQPGIVSLAQVTGLPIIPFSAHVKWKIQIRSWDRFQIPIPLTSCELRAAKPLRVARDADDAERERLREQLEQTMMSLTED
jgi:lysophospholipid acyltransferase (LPLAT)-like uncharacterized protein